jgi:hypothetical protein
MLPLLSVLLGALGLRVSFFFLIFFHSFTSFFIFALFSEICKSEMHPLGSSLEIVLGSQQQSFGNPCRPFTASVGSATPIFGKRMNRCYARKRHRAVGKETGKTSYSNRQGG